MEEIEALCRGETQLLQDETAPETWSAATVEHALDLLDAYANGRNGVGPEVVGGKPTSGYPACVAVGCEGSWGCSGTLIASNAVITAAHCCDQLARCGGKIYIKVCSSVDEGTVPYEANAPLYPPEQQNLTCSDRADTRRPHDIAVLILKSDVPVVRPMPLSCSGPIDSAEEIAVVGFGLNDRGEAGEKNIAVVPVASSACGGHKDSDDYGCFPGEIVAKDTPQRTRRRDTCEGDSGGPAIVGGALAAVTSRAIERNSKCGAGGVYVRVDVHLGWLQSLSGIHWPSPIDECQGGKR
jgi:hypothetical protein